MSLFASLDLVWICLFVLLDSFFFFGVVFVLLDLVYFIDWGIVMLNGSSVVMTFLFDWMSMLFVGLLLLFLY